MISYAQNFEDVILWRALKHVERGFYIDIGAQDPVIDSVSLAFYEQGWRGVHVEPTPSYAAKLREARPDEEVIEAMIGGGDKGANRFFEIPETGLSTGDETIALMHKEKGFQVDSIEVPSLSLEQLLDDHKDKDIHWLKIDVEGMERIVLESWSASPVRPWIVVVESTIPSSPQPTFSEWEHIILALGYEFVYFDGVNRYYISEKHPEFREDFGLRLGVFDDIVLSANASTPLYVKIKEQHAALENQLADKETALAALETRLAEAHGAKTALETQLSEQQSVRAELEHQLGARENEAADLHRRLAEMDAAREVVLARQGELETQRDDTHDANAALAGQLVEQQTARAALEGQIGAQEAEIARLHQRIAEMDAWGQAALEHETALKQSLTEMEGHLASLHASASWRITAPLRAVSRVVRWLVKGTRLFARGVWAWITLKPGSRPRRMARWGVITLANVLVEHRRITGFIKRALNVIPPLNNRMRAIMQTERAERHHRAFVPQPPVQHVAILSDDVTRDMPSDSLLKQAVGMTTEQETFVLLAAAVEKWKKAPRIHV